MTDELNNLVTVYDEASYYAAKDFALKVMENVCCRSSDDFAPHQFMGTYEDFQHDGVCAVCEKKGQHFWLTVITHTVKHNWRDYGGVCELVCDACKNADDGQQCSRIHSQSAYYNERHYLDYFTLNKK